MPDYRQLRREARARGLRWGDVVDAYRELKARQWEARERPNEIRQAAWMMANGSTPGNWPFWRHGFVARWGAKVDRHDFTAIPGYDEIGQQIAGEFPEYAHDAGTEELFEFLLGPYDRMPAAERIYQEAMDFVECHSNP